MSQPSVRARRSGAPRLLPSRPSAGLPAVDERRVVPETRWEMIEGKMYYCSPSSEPHGSQTLDLGGILRYSVTTAYRVAVDMLTRTGHDSDFAPDVSVFPAAPDPVTGGRQLEELAFEVVDRQAMTIPSRKAHLLCERGVRRVFCVKIRKLGRQLLEWDVAAGDWRPLPEDGMLEDRCLALPVRVRALISAAEGDDAVAQALLSRDNPVIQAALASRQEQGLEQGALQGQRDVLLRQLVRRFPAEEARVRAVVASWDAAALARAADAILDAGTLEQVLSAVATG